MAASKTSKMHKCLIGILAIWSLASLILIVVWATSPDMKGLSHCNADRKALEQKYAEERSVWNKDRHALEELVKEGQNNQTMLQTHIEQFKAQLQILNQSLDSCLQNNSMLSANLTLLEVEIENHNATEANLTAEIRQQQEVIENLKLNLTQIISDNQACMKLKDASQSLQQAAESQRNSCEVQKQLQQKQLDKCQIQTRSTQQVSKSEPTDDGPPAPRGHISLTLTLICISMLLIS